MYVLDPEEQRRLLDNLVFVESDAAGWVRRYVDDAGSEWTLYYPFSHGHGGGPVYLRRGHPPQNDADVPEWVITLLRSGREDDADGAATDLLDRFETWHAVLDLIEAQHESLDPEAVVTFINELGITDATNRRSVMNKPMAEVAADAAHFRALSKQALRLLHAAQPAAARRSL